MQTQLNKILKFTSKTDLADYLEISRKCLYKRLKDRNWKQYQIDRINCLYKLATKNESSILKIEIDNFVVTLHFEEHKIHRTESFKTKPAP